MQNAGLIREVRGVMTRFEPLTEEIVAACTQDGLTYAELSDALSAYGLSIEKVMHDPTRKIFNTCYADYDLGLYADIILQREFIRGPGQAQFQKLARQGGICRTLAEQDWRGFYLKDVPLSMLIYDFQRRYKTIPHETVFSVWHGIYKRIDYANGMWSLPVLREVFRYARRPAFLRWSRMALSRSTEVWARCLCRRNRRSPGPPTRETRYGLPSTPVRAPRLRWPGCGRSRLWPTTPPTPKKMKLLSFPAP